MNNILIPITPDLLLSSETAIGKEITLINGDKLERIDFNKLAAQVGAEANDFEMLEINLQSSSPTKKGFYFPTEVGVYANYGNIEVTTEQLEQLVLIILFDGTSFSLIEKSIPALGVVEEGNTQAVSGGEVYNSITLLYSEKNVVSGGIDAVTGAFQPTDVRARIDERMILPENYKFDIEVVSGDLSIRNIVLYDNSNVRIAALVDAFEATETKKFVSETVNPNYKKIGVSFWKFESTEPITEQELLDTKIKISLGDRTSISEINQKVNDISSVLTENLQNEMEYGAIRDNSGEMVENLLRLRNKYFINLDIENGTDIYVNSNDVDFYPNAICQYKDGVFVSGFIPDGNDISFKKESSFNQIKVSWRKRDNTRISYIENIKFKINISVGNKIYDNSPNTYNAKTLYCMGSSNITDEYGYWSQDLAIANFLDLKYNAVAGAKYALRSSQTYKSVVTQVEEYINIGTPSDVVILSSGMNDNWHNPKTPIGDWEIVKGKTKEEIRSVLDDSVYGVSTIYGALKYIFEILVPYQINGYLILNIPYQAWNSRNTAFKPIYEALIAVSDFYSVKVIDSYKDGGFSGAFENEGVVGLCTIDGVHTKLNGNVNPIGREVQFKTITSGYKNIVNR